VEHGEQNSHIAIAPQSGRDVVNRVMSRVSSPEAPVVVITTTGARYFLRQMTEASAPNLFFLAHNEVPPGMRVQSLGTIA
jgi:flagellar biosynthesis protein FlhA